MGNLLLRRRMMMAQGKASLAYGVYIQDTANKLWKPSAWDGSATANGIAVYDASCAFLIALEESSGTLRINSSNRIDTIDLTEYTTLATAITDFEGITNTEVMVDHYGTTTSEAAGYCTAYSFPNGLTGYLGSAGEWDVASKYKDAIESALSVVGGESMTDDYYWTSTFYDNAAVFQEAWVFRWNDLVWSYTNITNHRRVRPFGVWSPELPQGYTRLGYLESAGGNYIDTGVIPNATTRVVLDYQLLSDPTLFIAAFGCRVVGDYQFWVHYRYSEDAWSFRRTASNTEYRIYLTATERCTIDVSGNVMTIGDNSVTATAETFTSSLSMYIFALNNSGVSQYPAQARCYGCKIYDNGTLIRDYIPAKDSEGEEGLYDIVNDVWYTFVAGNPI